MEYGTAGNSARDTESVLTSQKEDNGAWRRYRRQSTRWDIFEYISASGDARARTRLNNKANEAHGEMVAGRPEED